MNQIKYKPLKFTIMFRTLVELVPDIEEVASGWNHLTSDLSRVSIDPDTSCNVSDDGTNWAPVTCCGAGADRCPASFTWRVWRETAK